MTEWTLAQHQPSDKLARVHTYSMTRQQGGEEIEFTITVREFAQPEQPHMAFLAEADKQTNQKTAAYTPCGWGTTLLKALQECVRNVHRFPYGGGD